jgi:hypothetical protein
MSDQVKIENSDAIRAMLSAGRKLKWLTLRNVAVRMDRESGKPLAPDVEYLRHEQIKAAMEAGTLRCDLGSGNSSGAPDKHTKIDIIDLWVFSHPGGPWWLWARQLCRRWAVCLNQTFEQLAAFGPAPIIKPVPAADPEGVTLDDLLHATSGGLLRRRAPIPADDGENDLPAAPPVVIEKASKAGKRPGAYREKLLPWAKAEFLGDRLSGTNKEIAARLLDDGAWLKVCADKGYAPRFQKLPGFEEVRKVIGIARREAEKERPDTE